MIAVSPTNERATRRLVENSSVGCRQTFFGVHRTSEARFNPEELKTPGEEGSRSYAEVIADERAETPCQNLENETNRAMVRRIIDTLTRREKAVLYSRFGLNGHD